MSVEDIKKMEEKIAIAWKQQYNSKVNILRKEFHKKNDVNFITKFLAQIFKYLRIKNSSVL